MSRRFHGKSRHGMIAVIALFYATLMSVLALGFCALCTVSVRISTTERAVADARAAAESGLQLARAHLASATLPADARGPRLLDAAARCLQATITQNADRTASPVADGRGVVSLADGGNGICLDPATGARCHVELCADGQLIWLRVTGWGADAAIQRSVQMKFRADPRGDGVCLVADASTYEEVVP